MKVKVVGAMSPVGDVVIRPAVWVSGDVTIRDAALTIREQSVSSALVAPNGAIVTERDLARSVAANIDVSTPVAAIATSDPARVPSDLPVVEAAAAMLNEEIRHLVVLFPDGDVGVISLRDVVAVLLQTANPHLWLDALRVAIETPTWTWLS
jgi:CBS domain-containing protein